MDDVEKYILSLREQLAAAEKARDNNLALAEQRLVLWIRDRDRAQTVKRERDAMRAAAEAARELCGAHVLLATELERVKRERDEANAARDTALSQFRYVAKSNEKNWDRAEKAEAEAREVRADAIAWRERFRTAEQAGFRLAAENAALKKESDNKSAYIKELASHLHRVNAAKDAEIAKLREGLTKASHLLDGWAVSLDGGEVDEELLRVDTLAWSARNPLNAESDAALAPKGAEGKPVTDCACGSRLNANGHCPWTGCPQCPSPDCAAARDPVKPTPVHKDHPPAAAEAKERFLCCHCGHSCDRTRDACCNCGESVEPAPPAAAEAKECPMHPNHLTCRWCPKHGGGR